MASHSAVRSVSKTLDLNDPDTVTLTQAWPAIEVTNRSTNPLLYLWIRQDGVTAVGGQPKLGVDNDSMIVPGESRVFSSSPNSAGRLVISVVGNGTPYTIEGVG